MDDGAVCETWGGTGSWMMEQCVGLGMALDVGAVCETWEGTGSWMMEQSGRHGVVQDHG